MTMMTSVCKIPQVVADYIELVRNGEYLVCEEQLQFCDLVENSFENDDIFFDDEQFKKYMAFEKYFPFRLFPWEKCLFALHCCTYWREDKTPRWSDLFLYVARGSGKNGYLSFEDFCLLTPINGIKNYHIDLCATSEEQAKTSFDDIHAVLENNPVLFRKFFSWNNECITNIKTGSRLRFRTSNAKTKDGGRPGKVDYDEKHAYVSTAQIEVFEGGKGKVPHPRTTIATTEGKVRGGPLDEDKAKAKQILEGKIDDNGFLPFMCRIESEKEIDNPQMWHKANPSLRYLPNLMRIYRKQYAEYKMNPATHTEFVIKRMNFVTQLAESPVTAWENIEAASGEMPDLTGYPCVYGIDYAKTTDFVSAGLLFFVEGRYYWKQHTWVCLKSSSLPRIHAPLDAWEQMGDLSFVDAPEVSPDIPAAWLEEQAKKYTIVHGGIDMYRFTLLARALKEHGFDNAKDGQNNLTLIRKSNIMLTAPIVDSAFVNHQITWGDCPIMRWYTNNACVVQTRDGNLMYEKIEPQSRKTDGFMAMVAAFAVSDVLHDETDTDDDYDFAVYDY